MFFDAQGRGLTAAHCQSDNPFRTLPMGETMAKRTGNTTKEPKADVASSAPPPTPETEIEAEGGDVIAFGGEYVGEPEVPLDMTSDLRIPT